MSDRRVDCPVSIPPGKELGDYANAFRVMRDGSEWVLEFLLFSATEKLATVVNRIRIREEMLTSIRDRLSSTLGELPVEDAALIEMLTREVN